MQVLNNTKKLKAFGFLKSILSLLTAKLRGFFLLRWRPNLILLRLSRDLAELVVRRQMVTGKIALGLFTWSI